MGCALALLACTFAGCDDRLEVRQAYDFSLSSWYLQEGIAPDETVEIRLTLDREGDYREARYRIGYIQLEGDGEVFFFEGSYSDYEINKARRLGDTEIKKGRYRKLMEE